MTKHLRLILEMSSAYYLVFLLLFFSGLFYYPESHKWGTTVLALALVCGVVVTYFGILCMYITEIILKSDPNSGPYLICTYYISSSVALIVIANIASQLMNFYIINSASIYPVFLIIFCPLLMFVFFWRVFKCFD